MDFIATGREAVVKAVQMLTGERRATIATEDLFVTASSNKKNVFDGYVRCHFSVGIHANDTAAKIAIFWEEAGLEDFNACGLFGEMNTDYQKIQFLRAGLLRIANVSPEYAIYINIKASLPAR